MTGNRCNERNMLLAYEVQKALLEGLQAQDRGVRRARWEVLRDASMPAILIEGGFLVEGADFDIDHSHRALLAGLKERHESELAAILFAPRD